MTAKHEKKWAYGVTTVPQRRDNLLPRTLASLAKAGFDKPRLFVDPPIGPYQPTVILGMYEQFGLQITARCPTIRPYGNWILALWELYIRQPTADRYAIFQDDFVTYPSLRQYLDQSSYADNGYWNLNTFPINQRIANTNNHKGWYLSNQLGKSAVALVFDPKSLIDLLTSRHMLERCQNLKRGWRAVDGAVVTSLKRIDRKEYVHNPSLVRHTGDVSSMGGRKHPLDESFRGEDFDALELIKEIP